MALRHDDINWGGGRWRPEQHNIVLNLITNHPGVFRAALINQ